MRYSELDGPTDDLWEDLRNRRPDEYFSYSAQPIRCKGQPTGIYMAVPHDNSLNLLVPINDVVVPPEFHVHFKGLKIEQRMMRPDDSAEEANPYLVLVADSVHERQFTQVAREIAGLIVIEDFGPCEAINNTIRRWKAFWAEKDRGRLTRQQIVGLTAELWFLGRVMIPKIGPHAVSFWAGPYGDRHDFEGKESHIEVKSTEKPLPIFHVSSQEQLYAPAEKQLYIAAFMFRGEADGDLSLPGEVGHCEDLLAQHPDLLDDFERRLVSAGYDRVSETDYTRYKFILRTAELYHVNDSFPRLHPGTFNLPSGVSKLEYDIDLSNIRPVNDGDYPFNEDFF
jgi:hypothetical protein